MRGEDLTRKRKYRRRVLVVDNVLWQIGNPSRKVEKMWANNMGVVMGAAGTGFSACFYLLDLATTMSALVTYYSYAYECPHAHPSSPLLRRDPICRAIRADPVLHSIAMEFWACLVSLLLAQPAYAVIFWTSLNPSQHPLRLAYFMPLIHLYRLLQLLCHSFSFKALEELQKRQREVNSLYNALGASLESTCQFSTQFIMAMKRFCRSKCASSKASNKFESVYVGILGIWELQYRHGRVTSYGIACALG